MKYSHRTLTLLFVGCMLVGQLPIAEAKWGVDPASCTFTSGSGLLDLKGKVFSVGESECNAGLLADYMVAMINFFFRLAIVLAVLMITIGGFQWLMAIGNSSKISNAKDTIQQAVVGLILAMTATLLFSQIDKSFTTFDKGQFDIRLGAGDYTFCQTIEPITFYFQAMQETGKTSVDETVKATATEIAGKECDKQLGFCAWEEGKCEALLGASAPGGACSDCQKIQGGYAFVNGNQAAPEMIDPLKCLSNNVNDILRVTEAYPPSSPHKDSKHNNGCAIDVTPSKAKNEINSCPPIIKEIINNTAFCGLKYTNEDLRCGGIKTTYWTANHIHLEMSDCE